MEEFGLKFFFKPDLLIPEHWNKDNKFRPLKLNSKGRIKCLRKFGALIKNLHEPLNIIKDNKSINN